MYAITGLIFLLAGAKIIAAAEETTTSDIYYDYDPDANYNSTDVMDMTTITTIRDEEEVIQENIEGVTSTADEGGHRYPCRCESGTCSCCTGNVLENINIKMKQRLCTNLTYNPNEYTLGMKIAFNQRVLYENNDIPARHPPPNICLPLLPPLLRVCARLAHVKIIERNLEACLILDLQLTRGTLIGYRFRCVQMGGVGVALTRPGHLVTIDYPDG